MQAKKNRNYVYVFILFSVSSGLDSGDSFGETAKLFEAIDEDELKKKLEETMSQMGDMFKNGNVFEGFRCTLILPAKYISSSDSNLLGVFF